jgi:hypothetical protein
MQHDYETRKETVPLGPDGSKAVPPTLESRGKIYELFSRISEWLDLYSYAVPGTPFGAVLNAETGDITYYTDQFRIVKPETIIEPETN